jgi:hypothetical protein
MVGFSADGTRQLRIFMMTGVFATFVKLWKALSEQKEKLSDEEFAVFLSEKAHPSVADVMIKWDE